MNQWSARNVLSLTILVSVVAFMGIALGGTMGPRVVEQKEFSIIGIKARTNNAREMTGEAVIPKQWDKFFKEGILAKIPNKADPTVFAIYTNYQSDRNGDYDFIIGTKVSAGSTLPPGMVMKTGRKEDMRF